MSKKRKSDQVNETTQGTILDHIDNLAPSVFRWSGYDYSEAPPSELLERMLMQRSKVGAFSTNLGLQILPCVVDRVNQWGYEAEGSARPIAVGTLPIDIVLVEGPAPILLYDQPNHRSILNNIEWYVMALGKLKRAITDATAWLKTPMAFMAGDTDAVESLFSMLERIERGDSALALFETSFDIDKIKIVPTNVTPAVLQALHDSYDRLQAKMFEELGVPDYNSTKGAQQTSTEVLLPMLAVALKTLQRFYMRREWADRVNAAYGKTYKVDCLTLGLIQASIQSTTGIPINLIDLDKNGIPDRLEATANE